jgi:hypothetical protein
VPNPPADPKPLPCPRCGVMLPPSGVVAVGGHDCPVYQCDDCTDSFAVGGSTFPVALTFAVLPDGTTFDPNDLDDPRLN